MMRSWKASKVLRSEFPAPWRGPEERLKTFLHPSRVPKKSLIYLDILTLWPSSTRRGVLEDVLILKFLLSCQNSLLVKPDIILTTDISRSTNLVASKDINIVTRYFIDGESGYQATVSEEEGPNIANFYSNSQDLPVTNLLSQISQQAVSSQQNFNSQQSSGSQQSFGSQFTGSTSRQTSTSFSQSQSSGLVTGSNRFSQTGSGIASPTGLSGQRLSGLSGISQTGSANQFSQTGTLGQRVTGSNTFSQTGSGGDQSGQRVTGSTSFIQTSSNGQVGLVQLSFSQSGSNGQRVTGINSASLRPGGKWSADWISWLRIKVATCDWLIFLANPESSSQFSGEIGSGFQPRLVDQWSASGWINQLLRQEQVVSRLRSAGFRIKWSACDWLIFWPIWKQVVNCLDQLASPRLGSSGQRVTGSTGFSQAGSGSQRVTGSTTFSQAGASVQRWSASDWSTTFSQAGASGQRVSGSSGFSQSGSSGQLSGSAGFTQTGSSGQRVTGSTTFSQAGASGQRVTGATGFRQSGSAGQLTGSAGFTQTGSSGQRVSDQPTVQPSRQQSGQRVSGSQIGIQQVWFKRTTCLDQLASADAGSVHTFTPIWTSGQLSQHTIYGYHNHRPKGSQMRSYSKRDVLDPSP
nr:cell wall protein AWA1-like [Penaeus vannamei]